MVTIGRIRTGRTPSWGVRRLSLKKADQAPLCSDSGVNQPLRLHLVIQLVYPNSVKGLAKDVLYLYFIERNSHIY